MYVQKDEPRKLDELLHERDFGIEEKARALRVSDHLYCMFILSFSLLSCSSLQHGIKPYFIWLFMVYSLLISVILGDI